MRTLMLAVPMSSLWACRSDPEKDAWHGAVKIEELREGLEACDAELVPREPVEPYVFFAIDRGVPDLATVYWCAGPEACGAPLATVFLRTLEPGRIQGDQTGSELHGTVCSVGWTDLVAAQEGDQVELIVRTGLFNQEVTVNDACAELEDDAVGEHCDAVLSLTGTRVE